MRERRRAKNCGLLLLMDVTCNRCGTSYEFEQGLISATGTTVKCTQCGHLFKVHRKPPPPPASPGEDADQKPLKWRVRRVDGSTHSLDSLAELTRLISAGQFQRDDEISRSGQVWRSLGEIVELKHLFDGRMRPRRMSEPPPAPRLTPLPPPATEVTQTSATPVSEPPPPPRPSSPPPRFESMGVEVDLEASTQPVQPVSEAAAAEATGNAAEPDVQTRPSVPEFEPETPARAEAQPRLLFIGVGLLIAAAVAGALFVRSRKAPPVEEPAGAYVQRGDRALASDRAERLQEAIAAYQKALALHPEDPHILSSISRVHAVLSQALRFRAVGASPSADAAAGDRAQLANETQAHTEKAKRYGERAAQHNPGNEEAGVALADALRLSGNLVAARSELDRARATEGTPSAETLRVAALLAIDEANGDLGAGRELAARALAEEPNNIRMHALLAYCLIAEGKLEAAREQLAAVRKLDATHPVLLEIARAIERVQGRPSVKPKPPPARAQDKLTPSPPREPAPPVAAVSSAPSAPSPEPALTDPVELSRRGEAALDRGAVQTAERSFQAALELDPKSARARTGLGYVALERSQPELAATYFRSAAKDGRAEALIGLGDAYRRLGRIREAFDAYQLYLHRHPKGNRVSIAKRQSELLGEQLGESKR